MNSLKILVIYTFLFPFLNCALIYNHVKSNLNEHYKEGVKEFKNGQYEKAADHFHYVEDIDPDFRNIQRYVTLSEKEGEKHIISLYNEGKKLQARKQDVEALTRFREVEAIRENYKDTKSRIEELVKSEKVHKEAKKLIEKGLKEEEKKRFLKARSFYSDVLKFDSGNSEAKNHKKKIQKELSKVADAVYLDAEKKFQAKQYSKAISGYKEALENDPEHKHSKEHLKKTETLLANIVNYDRGSEYFKRKRFVEAFVSLSNISGEYKDSNSLKNKAKVEAQANISSYMDEGKYLYNENKLKEAITVFEKILIIDSSLEEAKKYKDLAEKKLETLKSFD